MHIERLEKDVPDESRNFSLSLYELLPRIKLTDLLMEVANWTNFHEQFITFPVTALRTRKKRRS
ncbi:hypothetical protein VK70_09865 [Paenibacillus durus ATCC 35681]|uniref:Transposase n=1 Tax=Paenibacillus durus ATCC 35681 TaxID=1333534 RepID=A0A0F7CHX2_PAEDU|nr:hypothetical protein VK70_09865 [Paenibacillus durus ATCC 35681]